MQLGKHFKIDFDFFPTLNKLFGDQDLLPHKFRFITTEKMRVFYNNCIKPFWREHEPDRVVDGIGIFTFKNFYIIDVTDSNSPLLGIYFVATEPVMLKLDSIISEWSGTSLTEIDQALTLKIDNPEFDDLGFFSLKRFEDFSAE